MPGHTPRAPALPRSTGSWTVTADTPVVFQWEYAQQDEHTLRLYAQGKERQWNAATDLDWTHRMDPANPLGLPDGFVPVSGTPLWERLPEAERAVLRRHTQAWSYSQALHGEQFTLMGLSRILAATEDMDSKLFAATQLMDEARHVEAFNRLLTEQIGIRYPVCDALRGIFDDALSVSHPDFYCIAGLMLEYMALVMLTTQRTYLTDPLGRAFTTNVARDEARHVAFGRSLLRERIHGLTGTELREREDFALECCRVIHDGLSFDDVWATLGHGPETARAAHRSLPEAARRSHTFRQIIPALQDVALFGPRTRAGLEAMGLLRYARHRLPSGVDTDEAERRRRREDIAAMTRLATAPESTPGVSAPASDRPSPLTESDGS
ncbi:ferritin-like domain-containing protein [Streptomyces sp. NPDC051567]|uniref:ferritin-like domain-containing protein n=1 Tax=Streptomyces sp. NPDC051567 TaxID=3365660 RepID=UPI00378F7507